MIMDSLAQMDPNVAPVKWHLVESELSHLNIGRSSSLYRQEECLNANTLFVFKNVVTKLTEPYGRSSRKSMDRRYERNSYC